MEEEQEIEIYKWLGLGTMSFIVFAFSACTTVPNSEAGKLADAGISTANTLSTSFRELAKDFEYVDISKAFADTYFKCSVNEANCEITKTSSAISEERSALTSTFRSRAKAIEGLKNLYTALKQDADYDAKGDLTGAISEGYEAVETYTASIENISGSKVAGRLANLAISEFAAAQQKERLLSANDNIRSTTFLYRNALKRESEIYATFLDQIVATRTDAKRALFSSGLVNKTEVILPLLTNLGLEPSGSLEKMKLSKAVDTAVNAYTIKQSEVEFQNRVRQYQASIGALDALLAQHDKLKIEQSLNFDDISRYIDEIDYLVFGPEPEPEVEEN